MCWTTASSSSLSLFCFSDHLVGAVEEFVAGFDVDLRAFLADRPPAFIGEAQHGLRLVVDLLRPVGVEQVVFQVVPSSRAELNQRR